MESVKKMKRRIFNVYPPLVSLSFPPEVENLHNSDISISVSISSRREREMNKSSKERESVIN